MHDAAAKSSGQVPSLAYSHLNLRWNPFRTISSQERVSLCDVDLTPYLTHLRSGGRPALLVLGDQGRGKSTLLRALHVHFDGAPFVELQPHGPQPQVPSDAVLFIDEAQRVPRWQRRSKLAKRDVLVIASHEDHSRSLRSWGYKLQVITAGTEQVDQVARRIHRRIESARRAAGPLPQIRIREVAMLVDHFGTDMRGIEHHLYEVFAGMRRLDAFHAGARGAVVERPIVL